MKYGFLRFCARRLAAAPDGSVLNTPRGKSTGIKFPPTESLSCFQADCDGHVASEGRRRRKFVLARRRRGKIGMSAADPIAFRNVLRFINPFPQKHLGRGSDSTAGLPDHADGAHFRNHLPPLPADPDLSELDA